MKVAILGMGYVGKGMLKIFPDAVQFDEPLGIGTKDEVNQCELAIVCVPTPSREDGTCDISIIEEVVSWLKTPLILFKSAVEPGTTDYLKEKYKKRIVVSPEYLGEGHYWVPAWKYPDPKNVLSHGFMILGGDDKDCGDVADIFTPKVGPTTRIRIVSALDAELIKYMENAWGATKVIFANEMRDICEAIGASWHKVREGWIDDPRVEPMHTAVFKDKRGFGGKCFPKDTIALLKTAEKYGVKPRILKATIDSNAEYNS